MADLTLWSVVSGALGFAAKALWDSYAGFQDKVRLETWKIRRDELERRVSQFYWPLYVRLQRDDVIWQKVFYDLGAASGRPKPEWVKQLSDADRRNLAREIEDKILLPNHAEAAAVIPANIHLANADETFTELLARYVRHVDVYASLRSAGSDLNPIDVGEAFPPRLSEAVGDRLRKYQRQYEELLKDRGVLDLSRTSPPATAAVLTQTEAGGRP